jgi:6-pyruvoyltetrahydropterin/6-carboxytetrahydropterin synthase
MIVLERTYRFCASHRYWRAEWTEAQNLATFGKCALPHGHGHNYRFTISIEGTPDEKTGMVADLVALDALVQRDVLDRFDHKNINVEVPHFRDVMPTTENLARYVFATLAPAIPRGRLVAVTLQEDEFLSATCRAPA